MPPGGRWISELYEVVYELTTSTVGRQLVDDAGSTRGSGRWYSCDRPAPARGPRGRRTAAVDSGEDPLGTPGGSQDPVPGEEFRSVVWLLKGATGSTEGVLELSGGRLSLTKSGHYTGAPFTATDDRGDREGRVFDAPLDAVTEVRFPWWYFGGGAKLTVAGETYRLSFLKPGNATLSPLGGATDIPSGWRMGKEWRRVLSGVGN